MMTECLLRGYEGYYANLAGLREILILSMMDLSPRSHQGNGSLRRSMQEAAACHNMLTWTFQGGRGIKYHVINVASKSQSGLEMRWWMEKLGRCAIPKAE